MRRAFVLGLLSSVVAACSLLTSLEGLAPRSPVDAGADTTSDVAVPDTSVDAIAVDSADAADAFVPTGAVALSAGGQFTKYVGGSGQHVCVIAAKDGAVYCWGANEHGQLGNGATGAGNKTKDLRIATRVDMDSTQQPLVGVDQVSVGSWHSCARKGADVYCWGQAQSGAIGDGTFGMSAPDVTRPTHVGGLGAKLLAAGGAHTCVVDLSGAVRCWGYNSIGQLGHATNTGGDQYALSLFFDPSGAYVNTAPTPAAFNAIATDLSLGSVDTCALAGTTNVYCWGDNSQGQLGTGGTNPVSGPNEVQKNSFAGTAYLGSVTQFSSRASHACAVLQDNSVWCWGQNNGGQAGFDTASLTINYAFPDKSLPNAGAASVGTNDGNSCAVTPTGEVWCWGFDDQGQLGDGTTTTTSTAVQVLGPNGKGVLTNVARVALGYTFACALKTDHTVWCWGNNDHGQLGDGTTLSNPYPVQVKGIP